MAHRTQENSTGFFIPASLRWLALTAAVLSMGIAMPSCPGQQEMKQQIDALQNGQNDMTRKVQTLDSQVRSVSQDMGQVKQLLEAMTNKIQSQEATIGQLTNTVQQLSQQVASASSRSSMSRGKTGRSTTNSYNKKRGR